MKKILIGLLIAFAVLAMMGTVNQGATTLIRDCWKADDGDWPQWNYGNRSVSLDGDDFNVINTYFPTGGLVEIDLKAGAGGFITTVGTDTQIIFNDAGTLAGDAGLTWNKTTNVMTVSDDGASISIDGVNDTITASGGAIGFGDENLTTTGRWAFNKWDITGVTPTAGYLPYVVSRDGDTATMGWIANTGGSPPGTDMQVPYNDGGAWGAEAGLIYEDAGNLLVISTPGSVDLELNLAVNGSGGYEGSVYVGDEIHCGLSPLNGTGESLGVFYIYNGGGEAFSIYYPDLGPGIDGGMTLPTDAPAAGEVLKIDSVAGNVAILEYQADADTVRENYQFGIAEILAGDGTMNLRFVNNTEYAAAAIAGDITHVSWYIPGWVNDADVDIVLQYGTIGALSNSTIKNNIAAVQGASPVGSPVAIGAGDVLLIQVVNTGGDDELEQFAVVITMTE